ncbi:RTX-I toxin determinant A from serotypes 1/9 [compost metagenome]
MSQDFSWDVKNPAPTAVADSGDTDQGTTLSVTAKDGVLANDTDPDGDALHVSLVNGQAGNVGTAVAGVGGGTFTLNADGSYSFNPGSAFNSLPAGETATSSITYTVSDGQGGTSTATLTVTITGTNAAPVLVPHTNEILEDQTASGNVLTGATDADHDTLTVTEYTINGRTYTAGTSTTITDVGTIVINANGSYTFNPAANWNGEVPQITYSVTDGETTTSSSLNIDVLPVNDAPSSEDGSANVAEGKTYTFGTDDFAFSDPVEGHSLVSVTIDSLPSGGTLYIDGRPVLQGQEIRAADIEGGKLVFKPDASNVGENAGSSFQFHVKDSGGTANGGQDSSSPQTFEIHVDQFVGAGNGNDTVKGGSGNDVLLGDQGGMLKNVTPGTSYNIALVLDLSDSMNDSWGSGSSKETRLATAKKALRSLLEDLVDHEGTINISLITFKGTSSTLQTSISGLDDSNIDQIVNKILGLSASGNTPYGAAFNEATDWFDDQPKVDAYGKPYENLTFFLTDGEPTDSSWSRDQAFTNLAGVSQVHGIGIGDGVSVSTLDKYDNTGGNYTTGGSVYANFENTQGLNNPTNWVKTGTGELTRYDAGNWWSSDYKLRITDSNPNGQAFTVTMPESQKMIITAASGASFGFSATMGNKAAADTFEWRLLMKVGSEWKVVERGTQADTMTGIHGPGEYRFEFAVNDNSNNGDRFRVDIDDIRSYTSGRIGESQVVRDPSDLETALVGGSTTDELAPVGNDKLFGGEGSDILFGDTINSDHLPWGTGGNPAKPADLPEGSGLDALKLFLLMKNGTQPTDADLHKYISDNHGLFDVAGDTRGGNDELHGGAGNDILYGQGGDDILYGDDGNDILYGGAGKDTLHGGAGNDVLIGGKGDDILYGNGGSDTFKWELGDQGTTAQPAVDVIKDFSNAAVSAGGDVLDLKDLLQQETDGTLSQYLHFSKDPANSANTIIEISTTGKIGQGADQKIVLENVDLTDGGRLATDHAIINDLLTKGKLHVDHNN